jgi:hypothetical protein
MDDRQEVTLRVFCYLCGWHSHLEGRSHGSHQVSLEKTYVLKNIDIPEYYLGGNVELLGDSWKIQG